MDDYPDKNGNGIPDAFENRKPISEILNEASPVPAQQPSGEFTHDTTAEIKRLREELRQTQTRLQQVQNLIHKPTPTTCVNNQRYVPKDWEVVKCNHCNSYQGIRNGKLDTHGRNSPVGTVLCSGSGTLDFKI